MKKLAALALALLLGLCASPACAATFTQPDVFTVEYPDDWLLEADGTQWDEGHYRLGMIYEDSTTGLCVQMDMRYFEDWADFDLFDADGEEMQDYIDTLLSDYEDHAPQYVETLQAAKDWDPPIPFIII